MSETRENAREYMRTHPEIILERARRRGYVCPICGNGTGRDGTGLETKDNIHFTCFKCNEIVNADIIDIIGVKYGIYDDKDKFDRAYAEYGISIDDDHNITSRAGQRAKKMQAKVESDKDIDAGQQATEYKFNEQIETAHKALLDNPQALKHYTDRGLSIETIKRFKLGYAEQGHNSLLEAYPKNKASDKSKQALYNYVLPYRDAAGDYVYFQTEIADREQIDTYNPKYRFINNNTNDMPKQCFNEYYITPENAGIIFLCEGIYDALSVEQEGYRAIGGIGTAYRRILKICEETKTDAFFIIALDNDEAGKKAIESLKECFDNMSIHYMLAPAAEYKDYNEALCADRDKFSAFIGETVNKAIETIDAETRAEREEYETESAAEQLSALDEIIDKTGRADAISTGFKALDANIDDGIRTGLYVVGALSSLGKTTFCLQICDNLARQGQDVLFYTLEMSVGEILAKSISRETYIIAKKTDNIQTAKTTLGILNGRNHKRYTDDDIRTVKAAREAYRQYAEHIHIVEGVGDIGVKRIEADIERHKKLTGTMPVIIIDYLQILAPYDKDRNLTDKQTADRNILELKRLSRHTPIIAISSFNRDNYLEGVNLSSFKESGAIEYTSDILIGLQYSGMNSAGKDKIRDLIAEQRAKKATEGQDIELKILKNRHGRLASIDLKFYPAFNYYADADEDGNPFTQKPKSTIRI